MVGNEDTKRPMSVTTNVPVRSSGDSYSIAIIPSELSRCADHGLLVDPVSAGQASGFGAGSAGASAEARPRDPSEARPPEARGARSMRGERGSSPQARGPPTASAPRSGPPQSPGVSGTRPGGASPGAGVDP